MRFSAHALIATTVALSACGKETPETSVPEPVTTQSFLEGVPADTPYLSASVTPAPLEKILPWAKTLDDAAMPDAERVEELLADPELRPRKRRALALLSELTGRYTPEGLQELGFSATPRVAFYGIGLLPAARLEIDDSAKVGAFITRVLERAQVDAVKETRDGATVWTFETKRKKRTAIIALDDNLLRMGVATDGTRELVLSELLNPSTTDSLDDASVEELAQRWGMQSYSVGFVDFERVAATVLGDASGVSGKVWEQVRPESLEVSDACRNETRALTEVLPRAVFGSEDWSATALGFGGAIEMRSDLPAKLAATKVNAPMAGTSDALGVVGIGFSVGEALAVVRDGATRIADQPYQCEWFRGINRGAKALSSRWSMLPPAVQRLAGATVVVKDVRQNQAEDARPYSLDAVAAVGTAAPQDLLDLVAGFDTDLQAVQIPAVGAVATIPETPLTKRLQDGRLIRGESALAVSTGQWSEDEVANIDLSLSPAPFFHLRYDAESIASKLGFEGDVAPIRAALRGKTSLTVEPEAGGFRIRTSYARETGEE